MVLPSKIAIMHILTQKKQFVNTKATQKNILSLSTNIFIIFGKKTQRLLYNKNSKNKTRPFELFLTNKKKIIKSGRFRSDYML